MPVAQTSVAILPKAKGMFAQRIKEDSYKELSRKSDVPDIARFLRAHPYFQSSLNALTDSVPRRGRVEELLRRDIFLKYLDLSHYIPLGDKFGNFFMVQSEISELLTAIRVITTSQSSYIINLPSFLSQRLSLDLMAIARATDYKGILRVIEGSPYHKLLAPLENEQDAKRLIMAEAALKAYYYKYVFNAIKTGVSRSAQRSVNSLFLKEAEIFNLTLLLRVKRYFPDYITPDVVKRLLIPHGGKIGKKLMYRLADTQTFEELCEIYENAGLTAKIGDIKHEDFVLDLEKEHYRMSVRQLHLTSSPATALAAFIILSKYELTNVINVIEGVRYKLTPSEITHLLRT